MPKKKPAYMQHKGKEEVNKKALIWTGAIILGVILLMATLLILNR